MKLSICKFYLFLSALSPLCVIQAEVPSTHYVFDEPPENFKPKLEVATCYVMHGSKALFLKRCTTST